MKVAGKYVGRGTVLLYIIVGAPRRGQIAYVRRYTIRGKLFKVVYFNTSFSFENNF